MGVGLITYKAVGFVDDAGAGVGGDAVLVDDPFEGGAVAEAVVEGGGGDAGKFALEVAGVAGAVLGVVRIANVAWKMSRLAMVFCAVG